MAELDAGVATPVVPATPAVESAPAPDTTADQVTETSEAQPSKPARTYTEEEHQKALQKRLGIESRRLERIARAEARAEHAERQLRESQQTRTQPQSSGEPNPKDFKDWDSYNAAVIDYKVDQKLKSQSEKSQRETAEQRDRREFAQRAEQTRSAMSKAAEKYDDFEEVITGNVPFTEPMAAYIAEAAKDGGELAYYLGTHVNEALRISQLAPAKQITELHALETKMTAPPKPTGAPAPIVPNGSASAGNKKDWKEMSTEEHVKAYRAQKKRS